MNTLNQTEFNLEYHFRGKRIIMQSLYNFLIEKLKNEIDFEYKIGKSYIGLIYKLVFAAIYVQTEKIIVEFVSRKEIENTRIIKIIESGKNRWAYFVEISKEKDVDSQLIEWLKDAYE